jgi:hypothetical protein
MLVVLSSCFDAEKGLGQTRAYALMPQPETGKISCVHHLPCARLSLGVCRSMLRSAGCSDHPARFAAGLSCSVGPSLPTYLK